MNDIKKELEETSEKLEEMNHKYQQERFWELAFDKQTKATSGFSSMRAFLMENSVKDLNAILSMYMEKLSTGGPLTGFFQLEPL